MLAWGSPILSRMPNSCCRCGVNLNLCVVPSVTSAGGAASCFLVLSHMGGGRRVTPLKEALAALADALAQRPAEEILFDWFRSGRLVGELSVLIKRRHPEVQAEIDRVYQERLAQLSKRRHDPAAQDYGL